MSRQGVSLLLALFIVATTSACAGDAIEPGTKAPSFTLKDPDGKEYALDTFLENKLVTVMFIATQCPVSNAYNPRMVKLYKDYAERGVAFVGINSNKQEGISEIKNHAAENGFQFPVLKDPGNVIADAYGATVTPEVFVVSPDGMVRYHGRIDDSRNPDNITSSDLREALNALLSGKEPTRAATKPFGCTIKRVKKES
jgi:peroxiredoxin